MVTFDDYVKKVLNQIIESYQTLQNLSDKPGDLITIKTELLKINGLFQVVVKKIEGSGKLTNNYVKLAKRARYYLKNYEFEREIDTISNLYSEDPNRLRNIRLKILDSLNDKKLIEIVQSIISSD